MSIFQQYSNYLNNKDLDNIVLKHLELSDLVKMFLTNKYYNKLLKNIIVTSFEHLIETLPENSLMFVSKREEADDEYHDEGESNYFFIIPKYIIHNGYWIDDIDIPRISYTIYGSKIHHDGTFTNYYENRFFDFRSCGKCSLINECKDKYDPKYCSDRCLWIHNYTCKKCECHVDDNYRLCKSNVCEICDSFKSDHDCHDEYRCEDEYDIHLENMMCFKDCVVDKNGTSLYFYGDADDFMDDPTNVYIRVLCKGTSHNKVPIFTQFEPEDVEDILNNDIEIWDDYMDQGFGPNKCDLTLDNFMYDGKLGNTVYSGDAMYVLRSDLDQVRKKFPQNEL